MQEKSSVITLIRYRQLKLKLAQAASFEKEERL